MAPAGLGVTGRALIFLGFIGAWRWTWCRVMSVSERRPDVKMFNATALPAKLLATPDVEGDLGIGAILAKATFRFDERGTVEAETQTPVPLFEQDVETPLGVLPAR